MESKDFSVLLVRKVFKIQDKKIAYIKKSGKTTSGENNHSSNSRRHTKRAFPLSERF